MSDPPATDVDLGLFNEGRHPRIHCVLGAQPRSDGTWFGVWAPAARAVQVVGDFDRWGAEGDHQLEPRGSSGVWTTHVPWSGVGQRYRYRITTATGQVVDKADPLMAEAVEPSGAISRIADLDHSWGDHQWLVDRRRRLAVDAPVSVYEVHLGSWGRVAATAGDGGETRRFPTYTELADPLADHALAHGFTHVELLPVMEHPFYGSWGYQTLGYFAPTVRYGSPRQLMAMIDRLHQRGLGVILDWVPSHFPLDAHGLARFDGTNLYEHADPRQGFHPDWNSGVFNYGRFEVRSFLLSSAVSWLDRYHADGLRVDGVASMLYLDYSRPEGEWIPNVYGGRENLEAISLLQDLNDTVGRLHPDTVTFAEESTAWPGVTRPSAEGGLGFGYKWDMGWMHDTLRYFSRDPMYRRWHHDELTFRSVYASSERFTLPLSHDEVVYGKGSLLTKMPGDDWQARANLRTMLGQQWMLPGKKLLFMGGELGTGAEWDHEGTLDWSGQDDPGHAGIAAWVTELNRLHREEPALHTGDTDAAGFSWVEADDRERSVYAWLRWPLGPVDPDGGAAGRHGPPRRGDRSQRPVLVVVNATPAVHTQYRLGVPCPASWWELANSDDRAFGGSGVTNPGPHETHPVDSHGHYQSILITVPPLGVAVLAPEAW